IETFDGLWIPFPAQAARLMSSRIDRAAETKSSAPSVVVTAVESSEYRTASAPKSLLRASLSAPTTSGPTPWPKQVADKRMIAEASARMLGRATVCAMAKIGPRWKPTRNDPSASAATIKAKLLVRKHNANTGPASPDMIAGAHNFQRSSRVLICAT